MVHNFLLFPYPAQLSHIQTNLPAFTNAICGQNLDMLAVRQLKKKMYFRNRLFKGVPCFQIELPVRLDASF